MNLPATASAPMRPNFRTPFSLGTLVLGSVALLLMVFLAIGFLLSSDWEASAGVVVDAPPEAIFTYLDSPEGWQNWTEWPTAELVRTGAPRGLGATIAWDDPELGSGSFRIVSVQPPYAVSYAVEFGPSMQAEGEVRLTPEGSSTTVEWREEGNLGRNPLMGYWSLFMKRGQSAQMTAGLVRLSRIVTDPGPS